MGQEASSSSVPPKAVDSEYGPQTTRLRVMIVGDSMTQGQEGDWTWRYRIWQWFEANGIAVDMVGPFVGTQEQQPPEPLTPPPAGKAPSPPPDGPRARGGYALDATRFESRHFSAWGRAACQARDMIRDVVHDHPADMMLLMLGFNDVGWLISDAEGTLESIETLIANARAARPSLRFAVANIPHRTFIRDDLVEKTNLFNTRLPSIIARLTTEDSPISLVQLEETYQCSPESCPAGYDGLHPNELGEYQIARAFSLCLYNDFKLGNGPLDIPSDIPKRQVGVPADVHLLIRSNGVTVTWKPVYGAYGYEAQVFRDGHTESHTVMINQWFASWPKDGTLHHITIRAVCGEERKGDWTEPLTVTGGPDSVPAPS